MKNRFIFTLGTLVMTNLFAESKKPIPFLIERSVTKTFTAAEFGQITTDTDWVVLTKNPVNKKIVAAKTTVQPVNINPSELSEFISSIKSSMCEAIKPGSFKVWVKVDANTKILGIGTSGEGGIEVEVQCK